VSPRENAKPELRQIAVGDLTVLAHIQRTPRPARVAKIAREWDESKVGILKVAKITTGRNKGKYHVVDGGTRWKAAELAFGDDYLFWCVVTGGTEFEAAEDFLAANNLSKKPTAYENYMVGLRADVDYCNAMAKAFKAVGVDADESSTRTSVGSIAACRRIVDRAEAEAKRTLNGDYSPEDKQDAAWEYGSDRLRDVLILTREMYLDRPDGGPRAHDADIIQAVARIWEINPGKLGTNGCRARFVERIAVVRVAEWRHDGQKDTRTYGGSESRATAMARLMCMEHNKRLSPDSPCFLKGPADPKPRY
jgi:hypothetical protein